MKLKSAALRSTAVLFITLSAFSILTAAEPQAEEEFIKLQLGSTDEIRADGDKATARFPIVLQGTTNLNDIELKIIDVAYGKRRESSLISAFKPQFQAATANTGQAIVIELDLRRITEQGS